jgi:hypothetical protein
MRRLKLQLIVLSVIATLAAVVSRWSGLSYIAAASILIAAWLVNGLIANAEDDVPGGFNNPDGTATPRYIVVLRWLVRGLLGAVALGGVALAVAVIRDRT